ncbi:hypothetical protein L1987_60376 [Smallanthus sonchifolius]|uniref:Uncharacterized protein n=1 Tax=Smallanthus sonchifolius TaxID=185202 RepID=A0ACB9D8I2_9ASTR|nr:hypothetical protein L1987_60376 [Smallanthus sonchifolius]
MKNCNNSDHYHHNSSSLVTLAANTSSTSPSVTSSPSRYENQKRRDWNTFGQYLKNHRPPLSLSRCSGAHVLEFLHNLDQFGKTKVHTLLCPFYGYPSPPAPCPCPLQQACGSLDALIGRLRAAYEENGWPRERNPFGDRAVRLYLGEIQELQSRARGVSYEKKKRKWKPTQEHQHITPKTSTFQALPLPPVKNLGVSTGSRRIILGLSFFPFYFFAGDDAEAEADAPKPRGVVAEEVVSSVDSMDSGDDDEFCALMAVRWGKMKYGEKK